MLTHMENLNVTLVESSSLHKESSVVMCTRTLSAFSKLTCQNWRWFFGCLFLFLSNEENFIYITIPSAVRKDYPPNPQLPIPLMTRWEVHLFNFDTCPFPFQGVLWRGVGCTVGVVQWSAWPCSEDRQNLQTATGWLKIGMLRHRVLKTLR